MPCPLQDFPKRSSGTPLLFCSVPKQEFPVTEDKHTPDLWDGLAALVWSLVLLAGLFPEVFFTLLREQGQVTTQQAFTNSPWFVTYACAGFLGWFTFQRCRESGNREDFAFGKGVQVTVLALAAFLPLPIENTPEYLHIPIPSLKYLVLGIITVKALSWFYLVQLIIRYYLFSGLTVFRDMPLFFPSAMFYEGRDRNQAPSPFPAEPESSPRESEQEP